MLGRASELAALRRLVDSAGAGQSGVLALDGPAGVGKTALLDWLATDAAKRGATVLRAAGVPSESTVAWSGLSDLLGPIAHHLRRLPAAQAAPLAAALALGPPAEGDRFVIGVAVLSLLADAASQSPVVVLVDDLQWIDAASAQAIVFAGRRLAAEGVALVLSQRTEPGREATIDLSFADQYTVRPLDPEVASALLGERSPDLAPPVAERILGAAGGNPLALIGIPRLLSEGQRRGREPLPDPLPLPSSFERDLVVHLQRLPDRAQRALTVAAAHGGGEARAVAAALAELDLELGDLAAAEDEGFVHVERGTVRFEHPLMRSAAYHAASPSHRRAAHRALAGVLAEEATLEARARHLAAATMVPDEEVASVLEEAADQAAERRALSAAADLMVEAATLSVGPLARDRRRVRAAELALRAGATSQSLTLLEQLGAVDDPGLRADVAHLRGRLAAVVGGSRAALTSLVQATDDIAPADPPRGTLLLAQAAAVALSSGRHDQAGALAARAVALADGCEPGASLAELTSSAARVVDGDAADGAAVLATYRRLAENDEALAVANPTLLVATSALVWLEDFDRAEEIASAVVATARRRADLETLPVALVNRAWVDFRRSRVAAGLASATEALELADATGQRAVGLAARQLLAHLSSSAGRFDDARRLAAEVIEATEGGPVTPVRYNAVLAVAGVEQAMGRHRAAAELLESIVDRSGSAPLGRNPAAFGGVFPLIESYVKTGRTDEAADLLDDIEKVVLERDQPWPKGQVARLRGLLEDDYDTCFATALELLEHVAATQVGARIDWAKRLHDDGRDDEARRQLHEAYVVARRTGYHGRTAAIVAALASLGDRVVVAPDELFRLTGQELAVAMSVVGGASVAEAAAELFLSPQTVERELAEACRKLGAATPADLARRLRDEPPAASGCAIRVLGAWEVRRDGDAVPAPSGRAGTVVQLLAALGGRAPVDEVIEHLWPDAAPGTGRVRLRNVLTRVRSALGDCVERQGEVLAFAEGVDLDATAFEEAADAALVAARRGDPDAAPLAEAALSSYRGPLLPDAVYEPWADAPRDRLHRRYLELLDLLARRVREEGRWDDAARFLEMGIEADPDDHDRYVAAAEVRLRQGRRSRAVHLCRQVRAQAADLGVPPPAGLADVERAAAEPA